jgi:cytochrome c peroxidase
MTALIMAACSGGATTPSPEPTSDPYANPQIRVVAEGLLAPIGLAALPDGGLLVAEDGTGERDDSAGVSLIDPEGQVGRLISGLPSSQDSGDLAGVPLVALAPAGDTIYLGNFNQQHLWTLPLTPEQQTQGLDLPAMPLTTDDLTPVMLPLNEVMVINPFDIAFDPDGVPVVTDATGDGVAKENPDGTTRFIHRFAGLPNETTENERDTISPVPTGIERIGDEYYVTLTGGCPYPPGGGQLVAIDEQRNERVVVKGLNMPIDIAQGPDGTIWVLEFAQFAPDASCFTGTGYRARTGRLSRLLPDGTLQTMLDNLDYPGSILPMADGSLYLSEVFPGRILHITFGSSDNRTEPDDDQETSSTLAGAAITHQFISPEAYDQQLRVAIQQHGLQPRPGTEQREEDTALARLGQALFFDPLLSGDLNISCATCHHPTLAGADGRVLPIGSGGHGLGPQRVFLERITLGPEAGNVRRLAGVTDPESGETIVLNPFEGAFVPRNSPTILNSALLDRQFWDGRVEVMDHDSPVHTPEDLVDDLALTDALVAQALFPLTSLHEMAGATLGGLAPQAVRHTLLERLRANPSYVAQFQNAFDDQAPAQQAIDLSRLAEAIAAFERRLIFVESPWDAYLAGEDGALSEQQKRGALLFYGQIDPRIDCSQCHSGDLFTDLEHHNLLVPQLGPGKGHGYTGREDWGRAGVTFDARDRYAFRTPSLRNVALTAPYFHDGAVASLEDAVRHHADIWASARNYDPSANGIPPALYSSLRPFDPQQQGLTAAPALRDGLPLSDADIADLVAFLHALTDPAARDLRAFIPESVPSGLDLDPLPLESAQDLAPEQDPLPQTERDEQPQPPSPGGNDAPQLRDVAAAVGIEFSHGAFQRSVYQDPVAAMGGGLCWIDYDNNGWLDLYLVNSYAEDELDYWQDLGGLPRNGLYRNSGGVFSDVSNGSGADLALRGNGCVAADFNRDGWMDLYVTADGPNALLWNQGDGTFVEGAQAAGVAAAEWNSAAVVGDLNNDGWPDLFVAAYIDLDHTIPKPTGAFPQDYYGLPDRLYLNTGPAAEGADLEVGRTKVGTPAGFREVTVEAGLVREERGLGALLSDLDLDGDLDLYIANDGHPNRLFANELWPGGMEADPMGLGFRFQDLTDSANVGDSGSGMGVAGGDYDGDGLTDIFVTNWERELNALYRNESAEENHLTFQYSTFRIGMMGLGNNLTGWGTAWVDLDHDTDLDLLVVNGRVPITNLATDPQLVRIYRNRTVEGGASQPRPGQFLEWTKQTGLEEVGPLLSRGSAVADYDQDGDLDVAINTIAQRAVLLRNDGQHGNWLQVVLDGFYPGAMATVQLSDGRELRRELYSGSSYLASEAPFLHFGLGTMEQIPRLNVRLPDGRVLTFEDLPVNQIFTVPSLD